ncbi:MAG: type VI secretion system tip protein VgrG [Balneolaceae bacterium]|nr:type VI secretion system tip protein VgrG [Balneolaceae bacterium]
MPVIPTEVIKNGQHAGGVVTWAILIDGEEIPNTVELYSMDIWHELNRIPRAKLSILDGSAADETFEVSSEDWFLPGNEIEIQIGYRSEESTIFTGIVTGQSIKVRANGNSILMVECADPAVKLTTIPKSRYFYDSAENEVFETIIGSYSGLTPDTDPTGYVQKELLQFQSTDWDFLISRAEVNGMFCLADGGTIAIKEPDFTQDPAATVSYGNNLLEIDAEIDGTSQLGGVKSVSWDYSKKEPSETDAASASPVTPGNLTSGDISGALENSEWALRSGAKIPSEILQKWADSKLMRHELAKVRGRARLRGVPELKPGSIIELQGVGDRFNGNTFVSGIKHEFYKGEWLMDLQFGLSPKWFSEEYAISEDPAAGMLPSVSGLQIGLVTQIEEDPDGDERILVRLPMIDTQEQGVWARLATAGAGENRGVIIRPEIDDEVVVGFIHGDPNQPIILGSLNSAANPAPISASDDNHEKGWVTRGEIRMLINDDHPSITIEMPSGKKVSINDDEGEILLEDENGNSTLMNSDGITLESAADITIKATGDLNLEATNVNAKANAGFKAEGSASAEVSSSGSTTIKGSIVQIN